MLKNNPLKEYAYLLQSFALIDLFLIHTAFRRKW